MSTGSARNVVLVHGGFVDGSGWRGVYDALTADGYRVTIVQNPTLTLEGDAAAARLVLDAVDGPAVLVGHSYGGAVITEAGTHEKVAALAYISAFAPDKGESVNSLISGFPADGPQLSPAWRVKPSWYLLTTEDHMIPPSAQRAMSERTGASVTEIRGSHATYVAQPAAVAALIRDAAAAG
jgi:pimeloyl-ACP methyl ester carboxylesterase